MVGRIGVSSGEGARVKGGVEEGTGERGELGGVRDEMLTD